MNTAPHKVWITPQVFVLGAQGTEAYQKSAITENPVYLTLYTFSGKSTKITTYDGFQS